MNLSKLKSKIVVKKTERLLKAQKEKRSLQVSSAIKSVGIIVDEGSEFNFEFLKSLQKNIASGSKNFNILTCKNTTGSFNEFRGVLFFEKDFSWNGKLKSTEIISFLEIDFDMLIDYTKANTAYKKYLISKSNAKFKVGYANIDDRLYDLMIVLENEEIKQFNTELLKYLKILKKI